MIVNNTKKPVVFTGGFSGEKTNTGFKNTLAAINEAFDSENLNYVTDLSSIVKRQNLNESYVDAMLEDYEHDLDAISEKGEFQDTNSDRIRALYENTRSAILNESMTIGSLGPDVGLSYPLLKMYWIKNIYKDFVPTYVTNVPVWTLGVMQRYCQFEPDGTKYPLPQSYADPDFSIRGLTKAKIDCGEIKVPQLRFDLLKTNGDRKKEDKLSLRFFISEMTFERTKTGSVTEVPKTVRKIRLKADPTNGYFSQEVMYKDELIDVINGTVDFDEGYLSISSTTGCVKSIKVEAYLSSENNMRTPNVGWYKKEKHFVVPDNVHVSTNYTEELQKDMTAIYKIDAVTDMVQVMEELLNQDQDQQIQEFLSESKERIKGTDSFRTITFDFRPPAQLNNYTPSEYVKTELKESVDKLTERLIHIMRDPDIVLTILGNYHDIRPLDSNISWSVDDNAQLGGCTLDYKLGMYNKHRNYNIGSSDRIPEGNLQILIFPKDPEHMTYKLWQYQTFVTNKYRKNSNSNIPAVTMSNRFLFDEFDAIQGEVKLEHNFDSTTDVYGDDSKKAQGGQVTP